MSEGLEAAIVDAHLSPEIAEYARLIVARPEMPTDYRSWANDAGQGGIYLGFFCESPDVSGVQCDQVLELYFNYFTGGDCVCINWHHKASYEDEFAVMPLYGRAEVTTTGDWQRIATAYIDMATLVLGWRTA